MLDNGWLEEVSILGISEASNLESIPHCIYSGEEALWVELTPYQWNMKGIKMIWLCAWGKTDNCEVLNWWIQGM